MMQLYIWYNVLCQYSGGLAFALASSVEEARDEIIKTFLAGASEEQKQKERQNIQDATCGHKFHFLYKEQPVVINEPYGDYHYGGT